MSNSLILAPTLGQVFRELGFTEIVGEAELQAGLAQLDAGLLAVAVDAHNAAARGVPLHLAVQSDVEFPHLHRVHAGLADILTASVPQELEEWARRIQQMPAPPAVDELRTGFVRLAALGGALECAAARFILFESVRASLLVAAWRTDAAYEAVGGTDEDIDSIAEAQVDRLVAIVPDLEAEVRPFDVVIASAMVRLTRRADELARFLRESCELLAAKLTERAAIERNLRDIEPVEAALVRNDLAAYLDEQHLSIEELKRAHPFLLGDMMRDALDQRASRLRRRLARRGAAGATRRNRPSLYQVIASLEDEEGHR